MNMKKNLDDTIEVLTRLVIGRTRKNHDNIQHESPWPTGIRIGYVESVFITPPP